MVALLVVAIETVVSRNIATEGPELRRSRRVKESKGEKKTISALQQRRKAGEKIAAQSRNMLR